MGHYANYCKSQKDSSGSEKHVTFAMMRYEDEKYEKGEEENKQESKNPEERKVDPGTARNTEEPQGIPHLTVVHQRSVYNWHYKGLGNEHN